jgi:hypothetical protein
VERSYLENTDRKIIGCSEGKVQAEVGEKWGVLSKYVDTVWKRIG